jgi:chemotaxis protein methyltransferase CheR/type IV pilus assembly protein PilK
MAIALTAQAEPEMISAPTDDVEFAQWVKLLGRRVGLRDTHIRKSFLAQCIEKRMRTRGIGTPRAYFELLAAERNNQDEWDSLVDLLPLHETRFMRHESSLNLVREFVARRARGAGNPSNVVTLWSVGCSSGEEVYTLAIVALQAIRQAGSAMRVSVIGSDLSRHSLESARRGVYHRRQLTNLAPDTLDEYFDVAGRDSYSVKPVLREVVQFVPINLVDGDTDTGHVGMVDVVFCQNVLIYFDNDVRERVCNRIAEQLLPGGMLVLGAGEMLRWNNARLKRAGGDDTLAYQKNTTTV